MNINDLRVFQLAAKKGSISRAADELNYVQSNVTSRIKHLESQFNLSLFYRHARGISLTPAGKMLLTYTDQILHLLEQARKSLQEFSATPQGELRIGTIESAGFIRLPKLLSAYCGKYPHVDFSVFTGTTEQLVNMVLQYELDGAFVVGPVEHAEIVQHPFVEEELILITNANHSPVYSVSDIKNHTFFALPPGCIYRKKLEEWLDNEGVSTNIKQFSTLETILAYVREGLGICLLSKSFLEYHQFYSDFRIHSVPERYSKVETVFIRRSDTFMFKALQEFITVIKNSS